MAYGYANIIPSPPKPACEDSKDLAVIVYMTTADCCLPKGRPLRFVADYINSVGSRVPLPTHSLLHQQFSIPRILPSRHTSHSIPSRKHEFRGGAFSPIIQLLQRSQ